MINIDEFTNPVSIVQFVINYENTAIEWLFAPDNPYGYISHDGRSGNLQLFFQNIDSLENGSHKATVVVDFLNDHVGIVRTLTANIYLVLSGVPPTAITTDKSIYNVIYNRQTAEITGDSLVSITGNGDNVLLKFWQNENIFLAAENFTDGFTLADNPANPIATNPLLPITGSYQLPAKILKQTGELVQGFTVNLLIVDGGIVVQPEALSFEVFKGASEKSAILTVTNPLGLDFIITEFPAWVSLSATSGNTDAQITVTTNTAAVPTGTYAENIKFEFNGEFLLIPVTLFLKAFIVIDETKNFCLDLPEVLINKKMEDAQFVKITLTATYTVLGIETVFQKTYQQPYFQNVAKFAMGEKLHRHFPRAKRHFFNENQLQFLKNIVASIKVEELNSNYELLFYATAANVKLFPGKKPNGFPLLSSAVHRKKNENAIVFTSEVQGETVLFQNTPENDIPNPLVLGATSIHFYDFPKVFSPVHLQWENQNLCPEWFTFTGEYKIAPDFNHIYARNIFNAQNEKYDVSKTKTLTINTGMFLAKERKLITEIIESKISFIKIENEIYRCFNITKKSVELDSTEELIARDLEFLIVEQ